MRTPPRAPPDEGVAAVAESTQLIMRPGRRADQAADGDAAEAGAEGRGVERSFRDASLSSGLDIVRKTLGRHEMQPYKPLRSIRPRG
jgi:hypothetical protein